MNNVLLYIGGLLVVTLAAMFAVPHFIDWNGYRGIFEEEATKVLGRDVRVGGAVSVRLLPTPFVSFEKVRLADPTGQTGEPFVRAENFTMRLSGPALLRGVLEANEVELNKPVLSLALDDSGSGNWSSIQIRSGALPFVPKDVTLRAVRINGGTVNFYNAKAQPIASAEDIGGIFSADSIKGPFNFKGTAKWSGSTRELRFATTEPDAEGTFQLKATVRDVSTSASYLLDASVENLAAKPHFVGELTGSFPLAEDARGKSRDAEAPLMDLKAHIDASTTGAKIEDLTLSVQSAAEPQLISGAATAKWGATSEFDIALTSKWLDLDRLAGAGQGAATFSKVKHLGLSILQSLAGNGKAAAKLDIDQVKLGGETTGSMRINAARSGTTVTLKELRAGLPGGARLDLSGNLKDGTDGVSFAGAGFIHGTNLARLLEWAAKSGADLDIKADGSFSAEGRVLIADNRFELTEASADIGGRPFTGDISVSGDERRKISVTLEAARLDTSELFAQTAAALEKNLRRALGIVPGSTEADADAQEKQAAGSDESDISVRILAGELKHGNTGYRDVDVTVGLDNDEIRIPSAKFTTAGGLLVRVNAHILTSDSSKGTLAYDFVARTPEAVKDLTTLTGVADILPANKIAVTNSVQVAGLLRLGLRGPNSADISVDGTVEAARVQATAEFDGGLQGWRTKTSRTRLTARGPSLPALFAALGIDTKIPAQPAPHEAELVVAATGVLANGATTIVDFEAPAFTAAMRGTVAVDEQRSMALAATLDLKAADALDAMTIAGLSAGQGAAATPVEGVFDLTRDAATLTVASRRIKAGNAVLKGKAEIAGKPGEPPTLTASLEADTLTVDGLLSAITDRSTEAVMTGDEEVADVWPRGTFDFSGLKPTSGSVTVRFATLRLDSGIAMHDGEMKIVLAPEKIAVSELTGTAAGGAVNANLAFTKAPSGIRFDGALKIANADLHTLSAGATGKTTLDVKASAQSQSPAGLIGVLNGAGSITFESVALRTPSPASGTAVIGAVMSNAVANNADAIAAEVEKAIHATSAPVGSRTVGLKIENGIVKIDPFTIAADGNEVTATTTADLMTMALDSAWKLSAMIPPLPALPDEISGYKPRAPKGALPPIDVVYTGKLGNIAALEMAIDAERMQRELAVQLMERNVDQLERVRIQDEFRAQQERDRRKAEENARAAAEAEKAAAEKAAADRAAAEQNGSSVPPPADPGVPGANDQNPDPGSVSPQPQSSVDGAAPISAPPKPPDAESETATPARPRPRREQARRSTSDDIMRSLGGYP